jgi:branched-chain amino acid transport system permease protein
LVVTPPTMFGVLASAQALIVALFGGVGVYWGPVIGAVILVPLAETLHAELGHIVPGIQGVVYGLAIIGIILLAPDGIYWRVRDLFAARRKAAPLPAMPRSPVPAADTAEPPPAPAPTASGPPLLQLDGVAAFGGLRRSTACHTVAEAPSTASSARAAPARPRCSTSSTASCRPTPAA